MAKMKKAVTNYDVEERVSLPSGKYHVKIERAREAKDSVIMEFVVLQGTVPGEEGKVHTEFFSMKPGKAESRLIRLRGAINTMLPGLLPNGSDEDNVDFNTAKGVELVIEIEAKEYEGKMQHRMGWAGVWHMGHETVPSMFLKGNPAKPVVAELTSVKTKEDFSDL